MLVPTSEDDGVGVTSREDSELASGVWETTSEEVGLVSGVTDTVSEDTLAVGSGVLEATSTGVVASGVALEVASGLDSEVVGVTSEELATTSVGLGVASGVGSRVLEVTTTDDSIEEAEGVVGGVFETISVTDELTAVSVADVLVGISLETEDDSAEGVLEAIDTTLLDEEADADTGEGVVDSTAGEELDDTITTLELDGTMTELDDETVTVLQSTATIETSSMSKYGPSEGLLSTRNRRVCVVAFETV